MRPIDELCREAEAELEKARENLQEAWKYAGEAKKELHQNSPYQPKTIYNHQNLNLKWPETIK